MNKKMIDMLGRVFAAEVDNRLPLQTRAKTAAELTELGYLQFDSELKFGVKVSGYYLTHAGRFAYCSHC